ncbi:MAG: EamA family transporter [Proteobacteria bacterium]|nr:EamA family transporter [Pseudomonadota bacterium]
MLYFILTLFFYSTLEIASKPLMGFMDPFLLTLVRFLIGIFVLLIFIFLRGQEKELLKITGKQLQKLAFLGCLNIFFSMSMLQMAIKTTSAATAAVVFCSNPLFVLLFSIINGDEKANFKNFIPIIFGIAGTYFVMTDKGVVIDYGVIYALLASISFGLFTVMNKKLLKELHSLTINVASFFFGILVLFIFMLLSGKGVAIGSFLEYGFKSTSLVLYLGIIVSGIAYITFFKTLQRYSAVSSSYMFLLKPSVATILAIMLLGERVGLNFWIGMVMIATGGIIIIYRYHQDHPGTGI